MGLGDSGWLRQNFWVPAALAFLFYVLNNYGPQRLIPLDIVVRFGPVTVNANGLEGILVAIGVVITLVLYATR